LFPIISNPHQKVNKNLPFGISSLAHGFAKMNHRPIAITFNSLLTIADIDTGLSVAFVLRSVWQMDSLSQVIDFGFRIAECGL